ncbi:MAG: helix-turn-helix transcriptional regulator [Mycobacterium sp.]|nr:helix-turn-helix transcriptional regulator [Mycobacterium sp.]
MGASLARPSLGAGHAVHGIGRAIARSDMAFPCLTTEVPALRTTATRVEPVGVQSQHLVVNLLAVSGWDSLTDAELKVVTLITQGVTNRDVATQPHLSLHTVKTHVRNAFAKLGINSRGQLTRFMRGSD